MRALFVMVGKAWRQEWIYWQEKPEAAGHAVSAVGKQRAMGEDARPFFSFLFNPLAQSIGMVTAIPTLLSLPGSMTRTDTPRVVFPW